MATWFLRWRRRPAVERLEERCLLAQITEFGTGITANSRPFGITRGADGNLWFTEQSNNAVARITPAGAVTEFALSAGSQPAGIASGPNGRLYIAEFGSGRIASFNPLAGNAAAIQGSVLESAVAPSGALAQPDRITAGPDGNLWFPEANASKIGRITPDLATINEFPTTTAAAYPQGIAPGPDGALWFTEYNAGKIGRITTAGVVTAEFPLPPPGVKSPLDITAGPDGNLWFTEYTGNRVGRVTPSGALTEFALPSAGGPEGITVGPDGNLWFTEITGNRIGRLSPAGVLIEYGTGITANSTPVEIVTGPDGNLWFTELTGTQIGRLIPDLTAAGLPVTAFTTVPFTGQVAAFAAADPNADPGNFAVTIDWGDGTPPDTTSGTVAAVPGQPGHFLVSGTHTYANGGSDTIAVTITDTSITAGATAFSPATVVPFADSAFLAVTETGPSRATAGGNATYTITLTNSGPADAQDVTLTDTVPDGTTFVSATQTSGPAFTLITPPVGGTGTIIADPVALRAGQSAIFRVVFQAGAAESLTNIVTVTTSTPNRNPFRSVSVPVGVPVELRLSSTTLADDSPPGTTVGILSAVGPVELAGQFLPALYGLPAAEANNAAFALAATAAGEALFTEFRACSGSQASYLVNVHVDIGFGDQAVTVPVTVVAAVSPCTSPTAAPVLLSVQVVRGGKRGQAQELELLFNAALDPGTVTGLGHYTVRLGFTGKGKKRRPITVSVLGAAYDPVRKTVTLRLGKVKGPKWAGTLTLERVLGLDGVFGDPVAVSVDLRPKPPRKH